MEAANVGKSQNFSGFSKTRTVVFLFTSIGNRTWHFSMISHDFKGESLQGRLVEPSSPTFVT